MQGANNGLGLRRIISEALPIVLFLGWGMVACPVIQAIGRLDFEDGLRTRSPGEVVSD